MHSCLEQYQLCLCIITHWARKIIFIDTVEPVLSHCYRSYQVALEVMPTFSWLNYKHNLNETFRFASLQKTQKIPQNKHNKNSSRTRHANAASTLLISSNRLDVLIETQKKASRKVSKSGACQDTLTAGIVIILLTFARKANTSLWLPLRMLIILPGLPSGCKCARRDKRNFFDVKKILIWWREKQFLYFHQEPPEYGMTPSVIAL